MVPTFDSGVPTLSCCYFDVSPALSQDDVVSCSDVDRTDSGVGSEIKDGSQQEITRVPNNITTNFSNILCAKVIEIIFQ